MPFDHPFYFLRHGETTWNAIGITQGQLDAPLSDHGRRQAKDAAAILAAEPILRIVSSPLSRALDTAKAVAETTGAGIALDDELMEFNAGELQGKPRGEYVREYFSGNWTPPGGEPFDDFAAHAWRALRRAVSGGPGTLVVCHGGIWYAASRYVEITPRISPIANALPVRIAPAAGKWTARVLLKPGGR